MLLTQSSPGVTFSEIDLTTAVPGISPAIGVIAGAFSWGPGLEIRTTNSEVDLVDTFYKPNNTNATTFFSAANYCSYASLKVVRATSASARNSIDSIGAVRSITFTGTAGTFSGATGLPLVFTGGTGFTTSAAGTATIGSTGGIFSVTSVTITNPGIGYGSVPAVSVGATGIMSVAPTFTVSIANTTKINNEDVYDANYSSGPNAGIGLWVSKYPGVLGNSLKVSFADSASYAAWAGASGIVMEEYKKKFNAAPGSSDYAVALGGANDELHVVVVDEDGLFSGFPGTILETFPFLSKASDAKAANGTNNYYKTVINDRSRYINWANHHTTGTNWGNTAANTTFTLISTAYTSSLTGGSDGAALTSAEIMGGYSLFSNKETVDADFIITADHPVDVIQDIVDNIASVRKDVVVFVSPPYASVVDNIGQEKNDITTFRNTTLNKTSSYVVMDTGWKSQFDKYNNVFRWTPLNADIAGLSTQVDPWVSPAGFNKGIIKNVIKLAYNPSKADRDDLYKIGVNSVVTFPGKGTILYGDKTNLTKPSAFDRINVRRLFIAIEKAIVNAAQYSLFEVNDEFTRERFVGLVTPYLRDIQGQRGLSKFLVVCDETNNTSNIINNNSFVADIYIVPTYSINTIQLNFVGVPNGVEFNEIVGQF